MSGDQVFFGAAILTAFTDNAALTYLGSLVEGLSDGFKYALVAGAVTGGGLTIIANAPNPAGIAILRASLRRRGDSSNGPAAGGFTADRRRGAGVPIIVSAECLGPMRGYSRVSFFAVETRIAPFSR